MTDFFSNIFTSDFMPHGHCYYWKPEIQWLHVISDSLIVLAYYSIPITLTYFVRKRKDLPFNWMFLMFGAFILLCGTTHLLEIWSVWHGTYRFTGLIKLLTGVVSVMTAVQLFPLVPKAIALPSPAVWKKELTERLELEKKMTEIVANEHQKIGEDLHDGVAQQLTGILLMAESLKRKMADGNGGGADLDRIIEAARAAQSQVRSISRGLLPLVIQSKGGLVGAIKDLAERSELLFQTKARCVCDIEVFLSEPVATQVYKIAQEAVHNAAKHGRAQNIEIRLSRTPRGLTLTVEDDGVGFQGDPEHAKGSGMRMMRHRARIIDGQLNVAPRVGGGTVVTLTVPDEDKSWAPYIDPDRKIP